MYARVIVYALALVVSHSTVSTVLADPCCSCAWIGEPGPDCNSNGLPDSCDISCGTSADCNENTIPDECETDAPICPPSLKSAYSLAVPDYPGAGEDSFAAISLPTSSGSGSEPRTSGIHLIGVVFSQPMSQDVNDLQLTATDQCTGDALELEAISVMQVCANTFVFEFDALPDRRQYVLDVAGSLSAEGLEIAGDTNFSVRGLVGDSNQDGLVDEADAAEVEDHFDEGPSIFLGQWDVDNDGDVDEQDLAEVESRLGNAVTCFEDCDGNGIPDEEEIYGDVHPPPFGDGVVDLDDVLCVLAGFEDLGQCPNGDIYPCGGNGVLDIDDVIAILAAFGGDPACLSPCDTGTVSASESPQAPPSEEPSVFTTR